MGLWNLRKITSILAEHQIAEGRELENLSGWIWGEILGNSGADQADLDQENENKLVDVISRLISGEPVQYIAGHAWFYGMKLKVTHDVLIPRPETEELVHWLIEDAKSSPKNELRILDIGTGSGCIAIAIKKHLRKPSTIFAIDISDSALNIARENAISSGVDINFLQRDFLMEGIRDLGMFDIIVSNPPYISIDIAGEDIFKRLSYEPALALFPSGNDADIFYKVIGLKGFESLLPLGKCYLEMNEFRADHIQAYFKNEAWINVEVKKDLQGVVRMLKASTGI